MISRYPTGLDVQIIYNFGVSLDFLRVRLLILSIIIFIFIGLRLSELLFRTKSGNLVEIFLVIILVLFFRFSVENILMFYIFFEGRLIPIFLLILG